ncbi:hypothetical protein M3Y99_00802700 [Aphelenchoides fujianensis]|nr:hypothetical protein M3Y99_00802700 [Aphelenchoides fujianensis]
MSNALLLLVAAVALGTVAHSQMIPQCTCAEVAPCKNAYENSILTCADSCQHFVTALGANYGKLRQCLLAQEPKLQQTIRCTEGKHANACAATKGKMVPKRYPETLKANRRPVGDQPNAQPVGCQRPGANVHGRGQEALLVCQTCMDKKSGNCAKKLGCGLQLPADTVLVQNAKQCAIQSGFNTGTVQSLCNCASGAGLPLASICPKLQIS